MNPANPPRQIGLACGETLSVGTMSMFAILNRLQAWVNARHNEGLGVQPIVGTMSTAVAEAVARANSDRSRHSPPPQAGSVEFGRLVNSHEDGAALLLQCALAATHPEYADKTAATGLLSRISFAEYFAIHNAAWGLPDEDDDPKAAEGEAPPPGA